MRRRRASGGLGRLVHVLFAIVSVACQTPTSPQPPTKTNLTIVGQVIEDAPALMTAATNSAPPEFTPIAGAVIKVVDGPQAGLTAIADAVGRYALSGLTGTDMNVQASSPVHESRTYAVHPWTTPSLNINLKPIFQLLTETVSGTLTTHAIYDCDSCVSWSMPIHYSGELTASMT